MKKDIAIEQILKMTIEEICNKNFKDTNTEKLKIIKNMSIEQLNKYTIIELATLFRSAWICPCVFSLDDLCMMTLSCVDCIEYALTD